MKNTPVSAPRTGSFAGEPSTVLVPSSSSSARWMSIRKQFISPGSQYDIFSAGMPANSPPQTVFHSSSFDPRYQSGQSAGASGQDRPCVPSSAAAGLSGRPAHPPCLRRVILTARTSVTFSVGAPANPWSSAAVLAGVCVALL